MKKIEEKDRPTCSCGEKMVIVEYNGYYDQFKFFDCYNCTIAPDDYEADDIITGAYA